MLERQAHSVPDQLPAPTAASSALYLVTQQCPLEAWARTRLGLGAPGEGRAGPLQDHPLGQLSDEAAVLGPESALRAPSLTMPQ